MKIYIDTNFLVYAAKNKLEYIEAIDSIINEDYKLIVLSTVLEELKKLSLGNGKDNQAARLALNIIDKNKEKIEIINTKALPDEFIAENIKEEDILAGMDAQLAKKIKNKKLTIKNKKIKIG